MSIISDIKDQITFLAGDQLGFGVEASYYSAVLTGYDTAATDRDPSHATGAITIRGYFGETAVKADDGAIGTSTTFTIPSGSFVPAPTDYFTATRDGVSHTYTVTRFKKLAGGGSFAGYQLFVEQG